MRFIKMSRQDKLLTNFLSMTIGRDIDGYVANLGELSCLKDAKHQKELLSLKQDLKANDKDLSGLEEQLRKKDNELAAVRKNLEKAEADLVLANKSNREMQERNKRELTEAQKTNAEVKDSLVSATTKIKDMEDAVCKLLSKVNIPSTMIGHLMLKDPNFQGKIEKWGCREGGLIKKNHYDVVRVNSAWLGWSFNGFIISKLKQEGDNVVNPRMHIAKYVNLD